MKIPQLTVLDKFALPAAKVGWRFCVYLLLILTVLAADGCRGRRVRGKMHATRKGSVQQVGKGPASPLSASQLDKIVTTARSFTGTPYLTGGTSRIGMDCSGLTMISFQAVGMSLPRISHQQAEVGSPIGPEQVAPGDLVFFTDRRGGSRITHVGLITEVRDKETVKFIHTTNSLGVVENNLRQPYWQNLFVKAVRVR